MNYIDILLLAVMLASVWASVQRGFILSSLLFISWMGSLAAGFFAYSPLGALLQTIFPSIGVWAAPLAFIIAVIIARLILDIVVSRLLQLLPDRLHHYAFNKILGIVPGIINGFIWSALLAAFLLLMPVNNEVSKHTRESRLAEPLVARVSWISDKLSPVFGDALNTAVSKTAVEVSEEKPVKLPFTVEHPNIRAGLEAEMLILINKERRKSGLDTLKADPDMAVVARKHSADMFARGYFSHYTPEGLNPFERMKKGKIHFLTAGENLALAQTLAIAHDGLMRSPGHRANILNPSYGRVGIGILDGGIYGLMITQDFRN